MRRGQKRTLMVRGRRPRRLLLPPHLFPLWSLKISANFARPINTCHTKKGFSSGWVCFRPWRNSKVTLILKRLPEGPPKTYSEGGIQIEGCCKYQKKAQTSRAIAVASRKQNIYTIPPFI